MPGKRRKKRAAPPPPKPPDPPSAEEAEYVFVERDECAPAAAESLFELPKIVRIHLV